MDAQLGAFSLPARTVDLLQRGDSLPAAYFLHLSQLRRVPSSTAFNWWVSVKFCLTGISLLVGDRTFVIKLIMAAEAVAVQLGKLSILAELSDNSSLAEEIN